MDPYYPGSNFNNYSEDSYDSPPNHYSGESPNNYVCNDSDVYGNGLSRRARQQAQLHASSYPHSGVQDLGSQYSFTPQNSSITPTYGDLYYEFSPRHSYDGVLPQLSPTPTQQNFSGNWQAEIYVSAPTAGQSQPYQAHEHQHVHPDTVPCLPQDGDVPWQYPTQSLHIPSTRRRKCEWDGGSCGVPLDDISPAGIARHLRSYHFRNNWQARSRGRCCWGTGCRGDEMNFESMGKHVAQVHLGSTKRQCHQCGGMFARNDALLRHLREHCES